MSAPVAPVRSSRLTKPVYDERRVRIICIGAGASGLLLAYKLQRSFENVDLVLYEKNDAIAGTWYENFYPGCACDIPAHTYTWSFEPRSDWPSVYANSKDICDYFTGFATKYGLSKYWKLSHQVKKAVWDDKVGQWNVEVANLKDGTTVHDRCDILINASGVLNNWKMPDISGFDKFKGTVLHTARWDTSVDLEGKHVGLIGNGSSAIQVLPTIAPKVSKVTTFIRSPTWVAPVRGFEQHVYTPEERKLFETDPDAFLAYRKGQETTVNSLFGIFVSGSDTQKAVFADMRARMKEALNDKSLEWIIPEFGVGCRRLTPGVGYLETLGSDKVKVVKGSVVGLTETSCVCDDGQEYPVDVLICATGFDTTFKPRFPIIGRDGVDLRDAWATEPKSYFGVGAPHMPNYFTFVGPNSPIGNGPVLIAMEAQADYMLKFINRYQTENIHSFVPKTEAVEEFIAHKNDFMRKSTWVESCKSWYKDSSNNVTALWPGSTLHYLEVMREPRYEDWDFKSQGNRYTFFGTGFSQTESDRTADWAYYLSDRDESPYLSRSKQIKQLSKSGTVKRDDVTLESAVF